MSMSHYCGYCGQLFGGVTAHVCPARGSISNTFSKDEIRAKSAIEKAASARAEVIALRDLFAVHLASTVTRSLCMVEEHPKFEDIARTVYDLADAMMAEREKRRG